MLIAMARPNEFIAWFALTKSEVYPTIVVNEHKTTAYQKGARLS